MYDTSSDSKILLDTVQKFMADEIYPHEDRVDKLGYVPDEIGKQIEEKSKEVKPTDKPNSWGILR